MKLRNMSVLAALSIAVGLAGVTATGCQNLDVGTSIGPEDSMPQPGLDDPNATGPGTNVVPLEQAGIELEDEGR